MNQINYPFPVFIKLTETHMDEPIIVNINYIETIYAGECGTIVRLRTLTETVKETPREILTMIEQLTKYEK